jgi:hypothetical protein
MTGTRRAIATATMAISATFAQLGMMDSPLKIDPSAPPLAHFMSQYAPLFRELVKSHARTHARRECAPILDSPDWQSKG